MYPLPKKIYFKWCGKHEFYEGCRAIWNSLCIYNNNQKFEIHYKLWNIIKYVLSVTNNHYNKICISTVQPFRKIFTSKTSIFVSGSHIAHCMLHLAFHGNFPIVLLFKPPNRNTVAKSQIPIRAWENFKALKANTIKNSIKDCWTW